MIMKVKNIMQTDLLYTHIKHRNKLVPFTHAYTLTPEIATELLAMLQPVVFKNLQMIY